MFFEDEEFSDKKCNETDANASEVISDLSVDNDEWLICKGVLEDYNKFDGAEDVRVPDGVKEVGFYAFFFKDNIKSIHFPDTVKEFATDAVCGCSNLRQVVIENDNAIINKCAFSCNDVLREVIIGGEKQEFILSRSAKGDVCFEKYLGEESSFNVPENAREIADWAFFGCSALSEVVIPDTVREIGARAFEGCLNISELKIPAGVEDIDIKAFFGWTRNQVIHVPKHLKHIKILQKWRKGCRAQIMYY